MTGRLRRLRDDDRGFTLVETVVAMVLLVAMISAVLVILGAATGTTGSDRKRIAASNLAAREVELVRSRFRNSTDPVSVSTADASAALYATVGDVTNGNALPGAAAGEPLVVDGIPYTVHRQVSWLPLGSGASACDGGSAVNHPGLAVHVEVTWPSMSGVAPVVSDTVLTPPKGLLNSASGFAAVRVRDRDGLPSTATPVGISGPAGSFSGTTGPDGCAVFLLTAAGTYTVSANRVGYVSPDGVAVPTQSKSVALGQVQRFELLYDRASRLQATLEVAGVAPDGGSYALPTTMPGISLANSNVQPAGVRALAAGTLLTPPLFPWPEGYTAWVGTCAGADPAAPPSSASRSAAGGAVRGQTDAVTLRTRPVKVVVHPDHLVAQAPRVVATSTAGTCPGGDSQIVLGRGTADAEGDVAVLRSSLPRGEWSLQLVADDGTALTAYQPLTLGTDGREVTFP